MPNVSSCPAADTLADFALGRLSQTDAATLHDHLAECSVCSHAVKGIKSSPTIPGNGSLEPTRISSGQFPFLAPALQANELGCLGPYRILRVLGEGGMGMVFQAKDSTLERLVALKVMKPENSSNDVSRKRFLQEARAAASLQHDHIVTIYQVGEDNGVPYLAMQFLLGESLESRLRREGHLPLRDILRIGREMAEGLAAAHALGMIHRDIKPANIWLEDLGPDIPARVKILDFGLARVGTDSSQHLTRTGVVMGTPGYMAPEQARGGGVDRRCDLFSLGCVLYHMATGREPFRGEDVMATLMALALEEPPPIAQLNPEIPQALADLVKKLMAKNPDERPTSAGGVCKALGTIRRSLSNPGASAPTEKDLLRPSWSGEMRPTPDSSAAKTEPPPEPQRAEYSPQPLPRLSPIGAGVEERFTDKITVPANEPASAAAVATNALAPSLEKTGASTSDSQIGSLTGACPRCGAPKMSSHGWCLSCGYFPKKEEEASAPVVQEKFKFPKWGWYMLAGMLVIGLISLAGDLSLPKRSLSRAWWGTSELVIGVLVIFVADILAFLFVLPIGTGISFVETLFPFRLWVSAFEMLPKTRKPVCLLGWGLTTVLCATLLVGGQFYWFTKHRPLHASGKDSTAEKEEQEKEELDADTDDFAPPQDTMEKNEDLEAIDLDSDTDTDKDTSRPFKSQYVIIGYIPAEDQGISGIVIATPSEGKLQCAGSVLFAPGQTGRTEASRHISQLKVLADPPVEAADIKAIWVEPKQRCLIGYASVDENGVLQDAIVKKWESPKPKKAADPN